MIQPEQNPAQLVKQVVPNLLLCQILAAMLEEMKPAMHKIAGIWFF